MLVADEGEDGGLLADLRNGEQARGKNDCLITDFSYYTLIILASYTRFSRLRPGP